MSSQSLPVFAEVRGILFDFGGTLDGDGVHWLIRFYDLYSRLGLEFSRGQIRAAFDEAERRLAAEVTIREAPLQTMLERHVAAQFDHLECQDRLRERECVRRFVSGIRSAAARNVEVVRQLAARGFRLGVISNGWGNTAVLCRELGFAPYLDVILDSAEIGMRKPDPRFHALAAAQLRLPPREILTAGDSVERDIEPARAVGIRTALVASEPVHARAADVVISSLGKLLQLLPESAAARPKIKGGIFAAGQGLRLRAAGTLKPLVQVGSRPLIIHTLENFADAGVDEVVLIINQEARAVQRALSEREWPFDLRWIVKTTASSMESFLRVVEALAAGGEEGPFLLSTVDTILPPNELANFAREARQHRSELVLAVNEPAEDENPLWVSAADGDGQVRLLGEGAAGSGLATAGLYLVRPTILAEAENARKNGLPSLRQFLGRLLERGHSITAVRIANSIDVDRPADIIAAEKIVRQEVS
jgi:putative hydrolase of the HAD superfamily